MHDPQLDPHFDNAQSREEAVHQADPQLTGDPAVDATVKDITGVPAAQGASTWEPPFDGRPTQYGQLYQGRPTVGRWVPGQGFVPLDPQRPLTEGEQLMPVADQQEVLARRMTYPAGERDHELDLDLTDAADFDTTGLRQAPNPEQIKALRIGTALDPIRHITKPTMGDIREADQIPLPFEVDAGEFIRAGAHLFNAIYYLPVEQAHAFFNAMPQQVLAAYARCQQAFLPDDARDQPDDTAENPEGLPPQP